MDNNKITGAFILLAVFMSDGVNEALSSDIRILSTKYGVKLLMIYFLIFFTINFTAEDTALLIDHLIDSSLIFIVFFLSSRSHTPVFMTVCSLVIINHVINTHIKYLVHAKKNNNKEYNNNEYNNYLQISHVLTLSIAIIALIGFIYKTYTVRRGRNFSVLNYLITNP